VRPIVTSSLVAAIFATSDAALVAQEPSAKPVDQFKRVRDLLAEGKLDLAAEQLKSFLDSNPADADFQALEDRYGADVFLKLKRVVQWSENKSAEDAARILVAQTIAKSVEASTRASHDPIRIGRFVKNLGATPAEQAFAVDQLAISGDAAAPILLSELRSTNDENLKAGILNALPKLPANTVPPLLAAIEGQTDDLKALLLKNVSSRGDLLALVQQAETNFLPYLWYYAGSQSPSLKATATTLLSELTAGASERLSPDERLASFAEPFAARDADQKVRFGTLDKTKGTVRLWTWDAAKFQVSPQSVKLADAEEYYALRYLRWAVERNPKSELAKSAFLSVLTERSVERAKFGDLKKADPAAYELLASTPATTLSSTLAVALAEKRTSLVLGLLQVLGDRAQKELAPQYVKALGYADQRVQLAAANALLRVPGASDHGANAKVIDILARALAAEADATEGKAGKVLIADPNNLRASRLADHFRDIGFESERVVSGRDLLRRIGKAADFDLLAVDHHIADPMISDVLGQLGSDPNAAGRPILLVASSDRAATPHVESLLLRMSVLVAASETEPIEVPPPYAFDPKFPDLDREKAKQDRLFRRDAAIEGLAKARLKRLQRLVDAAELSSSEFLRERLEIRLPQLTYAVLAVEYGMSAANAPKSQKQLDDFTALIGVQKKFDRNIADVKQTEGLMKLIEQMEGSLDGELKKKSDTLHATMPIAALRVPEGTWKDADLMSKLAKQTRGNKHVSVIAEPFSSVGLADDVKSAAPEAAQKPRSAEDKAAGAKLAAKWLRSLSDHPSYDLKPAEKSLRQALRSDELAADAIECLAKLGAADTQLALATTATSASRPLAIRSKAADAAQRHVQAFGKQLSAEVASVVQSSVAGEKDAELRGQLAALAAAVAPNPVELGTLIPKFPVKLRTVPAPAPAPQPMPMPAPEPVK